MAVRRLKQGGYPDWWKTDLFKSLSPHSAKLILEDRTVWMPKQSYQNSQESRERSQSAHSGRWPGDESGPATARSGRSDWSWSVIPWSEDQDDRGPRAPSNESSRTMSGRGKSPDSWDDSSSERGGSGAKWPRDQHWSSSQDGRGSSTPRGSRAESWDHGRDAAERQKQGRSTSEQGRRSYTGWPAGHASKRARSNDDYYQPPSSARRGPHRPTNENTLERHLAEFQSVIGALEEGAPISSFQTLSLIHI